MYRSNGNIQLLASGARTTTQTITTDSGGSKLENLGGAGCRLIVDVTTAGTGSITATIQGITNTGVVHTLLAGAAITTISTNVYEIFPGAPVTANVSANTFLPYKFKVLITHNNANSITYSVDLEYHR